MPEAKVETHDQQHETAPLVNYLIELVRKGERGPLAELRREVGTWPNCGERALRHVVKFFPSDDAKWRTQEHEDALLLTAVLFAVNPSKSDPDTDMGAVMRQVARERSSEEAVEARFLRLLGATEPEELAAHLRYAVQLAAGSGVAIGWTRLERDLRQLLRSDDDARHWVTRRWARSFWQPFAESDEDSDAS